MRLPPFDRLRLVLINLNRSRCREGTGTTEKNALGKGRDAIGKSPLRKGTPKFLDMMQSALRKGKKQGP